MDQRQGESNKYIVMHAYVQVRDSDEEKMHMRWRNPPEISVRNSGTVGHGVGVQGQHANPWGQADLT